MKLPRKLLYSILVLSAVGGGFSLGRMLEISRNSEADKPVYPMTKNLIGQTRPDFILPDLDTRLRSISEWDGQVLLLNFWATWCEPCRKEMPALNTVRAEFKSAKFEVIGIALDLPDMVAEFRRQYAIDFPILVGQVAAHEVSRLYGNSGGGLPYSVFIDQNGIIRHIHSTGALNELELRKLLREMLEN